MRIRPRRSEPAPSALRFSTLLTQLREEASPDVDAVPLTAESAPTDGGAAGPARGAKRRPRRRPRRASLRSNISIAEILDRTRHAGFGFMAALLALIAIPFVGLSTPFGLAIAGLGVQMIAGRSRPWLPKRARAHHVSMATLHWLGQRLARWTAGMEKIIRPRFTFLGEGPFWIACGIGITFQGLALALPLPIPGSNWIFIFPIILYGIGLLEADGLLIMLCHAISMVELALMIWLWDTIYRELHKVLDWLLKLLV